MSSHHLCTNSVQKRSGTSPEPRRTHLSLEFPSITAKARILDPAGHADLCSVALTPERLASSGKEYVRIVVVAMVVQSSELPAGCESMSSESEMGDVNSGSAGGSDRLSDLSDLVPRPDDLLALAVL